MQIAVDPVADLRYVTAEIERDQWPADRGRVFLDALLTLGPRRERIYVGELAEMTALPWATARQLAEYMAGPRFGLLTSLGAFRTDEGKERILSAEELYRAVVAGFVKHDGQLYRDWADRTKLFYKPTDRLRRLIRNGIARA